MILVTGGAGYIGSVLVGELLRRGQKVRVYDKLYFDENGLEELKDRIELIQGDVRDFEENALEGIKGVIHLGSLSNDPTAEFDPKANQEINFEGTMKVAEACKRKGVKRFIFASTCAITGFHVEGIVTEDSPPNPQSEYAQSKLDGEEGLKKLADKKFCPVILRQATVYGFSPRMRWDLVVNTFTKDAFEKGRLTVFHGGEMWRPLVDIMDIAEAHILCLTAPEEKVRGEIFHLVYKNFRILELAHRVKEILRDKKKVDVDAIFGTTEYRSYRISGAKMEKVLGFKPERPISGAVKKIYDVLSTGKYTDFSNPKYYNIEWMKLLVEMEKRLKGIGRVF
jgi:nucleoside-diphosphate-sugar epimerase